MTTVRLQLPNISLVKDWNVKEVIIWLRKFQLDDCIPAFESRQIDGSALLELSEEKLFTFQDIKIKRRRQIAKCVNECKSQATQAKKFVENIKIPVKNEQSSVQSLKDEDENDFDGWDTDFEDDDEEENNQETKKVKEQIELSEKSAESEQYADHLQSTSSISTESTSQISSKSVDKPTLPKPPAIKPFIKNYPRVSIPRSAPMKRPPSQPPPPPIPQPLSPSSQDEYEEPIKPSLVVSSVPVSASQSSKLYNSTVNNSLNSSILTKDENHETYEVVEPVEENYEIVNDCQWTESTLPLTCDKSNRPAIPPRTSGSQVTNPPPLPEKPKKLQEPLLASTSVANKDSVGSMERPLLPRKTSDETLPNGISNTTSNSILTNLLGNIRDTKRGMTVTPPKIVESSNSVDSISVLSTDSLPSRSSTPEKSAVEDSSVCDSSQVCTTVLPTLGDNRKVTPPLFQQMFQSNDDGSANVANRPLPPVPVQLQNEQLSEQPWFHNIEREVAEERVSNLSQDGTYIVRPSKRAGLSNPFTLTVSHGGKIFHLNIRQRSDGMYSLGKEKPREKAFSTVIDLITFHQKEPILLTSHGECAGKTTLCFTLEK